MMQPEKNSRIDVVELKAQMLKKIGRDRFKRYFHCLNRFINQKISKSDFDKSCYRILGRENLSMHNQIIKSILKNACNAKTAPPIPEAGPVKPPGVTTKSSQFIEDGHVHGGISVHNQSSVAPWLNGVVLPSPRKVRSNRKPKDRSSPLGPNGKTDSVSHKSTATDDISGEVLENGFAVPCDYQRPLQHLQELAEQPENEQGLRRKKSIDIPPSLVCEGQNSVPVVEDREEVEQDNLLRSPLIAPLGIPYCSASVGGSRKAVSVKNSGDFVSCFDSGALCDSEEVRKHMEQIAALQGLGGVTLECANMLNNMVDVYLKRLIRSCVELVGARSANDSIKSPVQKQVIHGKLINTPWPSNHLYMQGGPGMVEQQRNHRPLSLHDFKIAMELNPQQLGEDWPLLLEKISMQAFEE